MIEREEIRLAVEKLAVPTEYVERDYVFGWLLSGIFQGPLATHLVVKGCNGLRKVYFPGIRYSSDLDFAIPGTLSVESLRAGLLRAVQRVREQTSVEFDVDHIRVMPKTRIDRSLPILEAEIGFRSFLREPGRMDRTVSIDFTQSERLLFDPAERTLIHPYSDANRCVVPIRCIRLEEILAVKLKCLLQRRHVADLYDYVHWLFFGKENVNVATILSVFLQKTVFGSDPGAAFELLVGLPYQLLREAWGNVVAPAKSLVNFDDALSEFISHLRELFGSYTKSNDQHRWRPEYFFPFRLRNAIIEAGDRRTLLRTACQGHERLVEPYALRHKTLKGERAHEYLYAYDRTGYPGGDVGVTLLRPPDFESAEVTNIPFEPRFEIEMSKAGGPSQADELADRRHVPTFGISQRTAPGGPFFAFRCTVCQRICVRRSFDCSLRQHKDGMGSVCRGAIGSYVKTRW